MKGTKFTDSQPASGGPPTMPGSSQAPPGGPMLGRFGSGDGGSSSFYPAMGPGGMMGGMPMMGPGMPMPMGGAFNPLMMMMMLSYSGLQQQFQNSMNPAGGSSASGAFTPVGRLLGRDAGPRPFYPDSTLVARGGHGLGGAPSLALTAAAETACYRCTICKRTLSVDYFRAKKKKSEPMRSKVLGTIACSRCVWIRSADIYCTNCNQFHRVRTTMANAPVSCGVGNQRKRRPHICHTRFCFEHFVYHMPAATFVERSNAVCKDFDEFVAAYGPMDNVFVPSPKPATFDSTTDSATIESQPAPRIIEVSSAAASAVVSAALAALAASDNLHVE
eukprot:c16701_g1_i3.p1 GENE.c16701_g1_i3~~c16701_g1_i3.p1  ORF type:complete len:332 (+),score=32.77 c16701_g1_i3:162-1157(+)